MDRLRTTALAVTAAILVNIFGFTAFASDTDTADAGVFFGSEAREFNLTAETDNNYTIPVETKDGREGWKMSSGTSAKNLNFNLSNTLLYQNNGSKRVYIEVEYYDEGKGRFALVYDGISSNAAEYDEYVMLTDSGEWKTYTFILSDAYFGDRCNSRYDFCLSMYTNVMGGSPSDIVFGSVKVNIDGYSQTAGLSIENGALGGIFFTGEKPYVNLLIRSLSVWKNTVNLHYTLFDESGNVCWSDEEKNYTLSFKPKKIQIYPEIEKYGIYNLKIEARNDEKKIYSSAEREISYVNSDGKTVNKEAGISARFANSTWYTAEDVEKSERLVKMLGVGMSRTEEAWNNFEKVRGSFEISDRYEESLKAYNLYGIGLTSIASYGNPVYDMDRMALPYTEEQLNGYYNYCYNVIKNSGGAIKCLEIWNEPNVSTFNADNRTPEDYVKVMEAGYKAAKAADSDITVAGMALSGYNLDWVRRILQAGGGEYMDCFSVHPYTFALSPVKGGLERKIESYRQTFAEYGYPDMPVWVTEMGWASSLQDNIDEYSQANFNVQNFMMLKGLGVEKLIFFTLHDTGVTNGSQIYNRQHNFGMLRYFTKGSETSTEIANVWGAKPAYLAVANMNMHMADCTYIDRKIIDDDIYLYKFRRSSDNKTVYTMWNENGNTQLALKSTSTDIKIYDTYGNEIPLTPIDGVYSFMTDNSVIYIEGNDFELEKAESIFKIEKTDFKATQNEEVHIGIYADSTEEFEVRANSADKHARFTCTENIKDGRGELLLASGCGAIGGYEYAGFEITSGGRLYMTGRIKCEYIKLTEITFGTKLLSLNSYNRWSGYVDITNNRSEEPVSGILSISEPLFAAKTVKSLKIPEVMPGETKRIDFSLPEIVRKGTYEVSATARWSTGNVQQITGNLNFTVAPYAETKPVIDGKIDDGEWNFGAAMLLNKQSQAHDLTGFRWMGTDDLSAKTAVEWDEENLYVCIIAQDDVFYKTPESDIGRYIYKGDAFQFAISYDKGMGLTDSTEIYTNIGAAMTVNGEYVYVYSSEELTIKVGENKECPCKITREGTTTTYEIALPWSQIISSTVSIEAGDRLAFTMLLNDNDGQGRKGWLEYTKGLGENANSNYFATLTLLPDTRNNR